MISGDYMKYFCEAVESIRQRKIGYQGSNEKGEETIGLFTPNSDIWEAIAECQPLVFLEAKPWLDGLVNEYKFSMITLPNMLTGKPDFLILTIKDPTFSQPFKSISIEIKDGILSKSSSMTINSLISLELAPGEFSIIVYGKDLDLNDSTCMFLPAAFDNLKNYVNLLYSSQQGKSDEDLDKKIKVYTKAQTRYTTVNQSIYIRPKRLYETNVSYVGSKKVIWSHRWMVRGHWVKLPGRIGKDRTGEYCVDGFTWRKDHVKGPEDRALIAKTRIVAVTDNDTVSVPHPTI